MPTGPSRDPVLHRLARHQRLGGLVAVSVAGPDEPLLEVSRDAGRVDRAQARDEVGVDGGRRRVQDDLDVPGQRQVAGQRLARVDEDGLGRLGGVLRLGPHRRRRGVAARVAARAPRGQVGVVRVDVGGLVARRLGREAAVAVAGVGAPARVEEELAASRPGRRPVGEIAPAVVQDVGADGADSASPRPLSRRSNQARWTSSALVNPRFESSEPQTGRPRLVRPRPHDQPLLGVPARRACPT